jgi:hypothetical protein
MYDAALTSLWLHDRISREIAVRHVHVSPAFLKETIMEPVLIMKTASCLLAIAALGGLTMAGIRLIGKPQPPIWLAMLLAATWAATRA